jgi:hypothetical protein
MEMLLNQFLSGNQQAGLPRPASGGPSAKFILSEVEGLRTGVEAASAGVSRQKLTRIIGLSHKVEFCGIIRVWVHYSQYDLLPQC